MYFFLRKFEGKSHFSQREREFFFYKSRVSRRKREIENCFLRSSYKKELILTGILKNENSRHSLLQ